MYITVLYKSPRTSVWIIADPSAVYGVFLQALEMNPGEWAVVSLTRILLQCNTDPPGGAVAASGAHSDATSTTSNSWSSLYLVKLI